jgi:spermidine synthase
MRGFRSSASRNQNFDVLVIDAFSSDAIPVHLITSQALGIYRRHMKPGGVIAFHVTNRFLNLVPVVEGLAHAHQLMMIDISDTPAAPASSSDWLLLSGPPRVARQARSHEAAREVEVRQDWRLWTDDFNNLVQVLK